MNIKKILTISALLLSGALSFAAPKPLIILETENFIPGDWVKIALDGQKLVHTGNSKTQPFILINVPEEAEYNVWANGYDFAKQAPATRKFKIVVNDVATAQMGGTHGKDGWQWQNLGKLKLKKGVNKIDLVNVGNYPRCEAIIFALDDKFEPKDSFNTVHPRRKHYAKIVEFDSVDYKSDFNKVKRLKKIDNAHTIAMQNGNHRIAYTQKADKDGNVFYERSIEIKKDGNWVRIADCKDELLYVGYNSKNPKYDDHGYFCIWTTPMKSTAVYKAADYNIELPLTQNYPYFAENMQVLRPKSVKRISKTALALDYGNSITAKIEMVGDSPILKFTTNVPVNKDGFYTVGMLGYSALNKTDVKNSMLPPLFQLRNLMELPKIVGNRFTSQPIAMFETKLESGEPLTWAMSADISNLPKEEWSHIGSSIYGFSLASPSNKAQTAIFQPIMGGRNSEKKSGEKIESSWYLVCDTKNWYETLELVNNTIYPASKYFRESFDTSFSDAVANIAGYLKNGNASGWDARHKARWNIEDDTLVTVSCPMAEIEAAIIFNDEDYYKNFALPTIEYTLTRQSAHFSTRNASSPYNEKPYDLCVPSKMWKADYYAGLKKLLGGANIWLDEFSQFDPKKRHYAINPNWTVLLGLYHANPSPELLEQVKKEADEWFDKSFFNTTDKEMNYVAFVNVSSYPYWWYLPDLYEVTKDKKYLDMAVRGAFHSMASLWAYPEPSDGEITINKNNVVHGIQHEWWRGNEHYRLGIENQKAAKDLAVDGKAKLTNWFVFGEKKVDAKKVSRIGLGIEQPSTFKAGGTNHDHNILMPSWSAEMLRTYSHSGNDILKKYSRHSIIGRYANFVGYYICDYTDVQHDADYPVKGPDITSFYYHHAPCHFEQSVDYLMAQFEIAANGALELPYVRQQGYVWFTDRVFGATGKLFGQPVKIHLEKSAVRPDNTKVSVLTLRSKDAVYALLLNDSASDITCNVDFASTAKLFNGAKTNDAVLLLDGKGLEVSKMSFFGDKKISIKPQEIVALKIPMQELDVQTPLPPLPEGGHIQKKDASKILGDMHAFRIRSPFGKDSLYVMFTKGVDAKDTKMVVEISSPSKQTISVDRFPYEVSVYPVSMDETLKFSVSVKKENSESENVGEFEIKGK